jgi:phage repressor protein C with HTH and peptisase S24 domain
MMSFASMPPIVGAPNDELQAVPNPDVLRLTYMSTLAERMALAMQRSGITQAQLARAAGVKPPSVNNWLSGATKELKGNSAVRAARAMNVSSHWLTTGRGPIDHVEDLDSSEIPDDYEAVRRVEFKLSAGVSGFEVEYLNGDSPPIFFRKDWLKQRSLRADCLFAVVVSGASMEPGLYDADIVVVNTADIREQDGEVFAVNFEGELVIKRLIRDEGHWWLASDNVDQRRYPRKRCDDRVALVGRIVHKQSERI